MHAVQKGKLDRAAKYVPRILRFKIRVARHLIRMETRLLPDDVPLDLEGGIDRYRCTLREGEAGPLLGADLEIALRPQMPMDCLEEEDVALTRGNGRRFGEGSRRDGDFIS